MKTNKKKMGNVCFDNNNIGISRESTAASFDSELLMKADQKIDFYSPNSRCKSFSFFSFLTKNCSSTV
jgi:hypothetical protein